MMVWRLFQITLVLGGMLLLILIGLMGMLRCQPATSAWLFYQSGGTVYRAQPDGGAQEVVLTLQRPVEQSLLIESRKSVLLKTTQSDQTGREESLILRLNYAYTAHHDEVLRIHDRVEMIGPSSDGESVFVATIANNDIYRLDWQQHRFDNLTNTPSSSEYFVEASPNGEWVLFVPFTPPDSGWQVLSTKTGAITPLLPSNRFEGFTFLAFSPNNEWVYLYGQESDNTLFIRVRPSTGATETVFRINGPITVGHWSPDGRYLPIIQGTHTAAQLFLFDTTSTSEKLYHVTDAAISQYGFVDWTADGEWIIFGSDRDNNGVWGYYRVRPDGSTLQQLTFLNNHATYLAQSPDGQWLVFQTNDERNRPILHSLNYDQRLHYQLTRADDFPVFKTWSPDADWIYFVGGANGDRQLYRVQIDGSHRQQLTDDPLGADFLLWSPLIDLAWHSTRLSSITITLIVSGLLLAYLPRRYASEVPGVSLS